MFFLMERSEWILGVILFSDTLSRFIVLVSFDIFAVDFPNPLRPEKFENPEASFYHFRAATCTTAISIRFMS